MHTLPKNHKELAMVIAAERGAAMQQRTVLLADIIEMVESKIINIPKLHPEQVKIGNGLIDYPEKLNQALDELIKEIKNYEK
jgi:hypothetical protein